MNPVVRLAVFSLASLSILCAFADGAACPPSNKVELMKATTPGYADAGPYDISKVKSAKVFVLDNGQIWRQADGFRLPNAKVGATVELKRGALGSYRLVPRGSNRWVQVVRMR